MSKKKLTTAILLILFAASTHGVRAVSQSDQRPSYKPISKHNHDHELSVDGTSGDFILESVNGAIGCRDATTEESKALADRDDRLQLHVITPPPVSRIDSAEAGLTIILRATQQLESFPQAKNAFLRAAETWENIIRSPITVIIDVDYGPLRFGQPYPDPNILGSTSAQKIGSQSAYPEVRSRLIAQAGSPRESQIDGALPAGAIQSDIGSTTGVFAPSAVFRALGLISPVADPSTETSLGRPPGIGFNSNFAFDFNPDDGIDADKSDFDAVAVHELGHALGFMSNVGSLELNPGNALAVTFLDLFRLRPGASLSSFPTATRIQSSGGAQVFFFGPSELALSTGRPDASGGDGQQASHWRDDDVGGQYLGIMDPTIPRGRRFTITDNDLMAFDAFGYDVRKPGGGNTVALVSGVPQRGSIPEPPEGQAVVGHTQYSIQAPGGAVELEIELSGNQDVDLYVRFDKPVSPDSSGRPLADFISESPTGDESVVVSPSSSPPLKSGTYYIAIVNFGPGAATFDVRASVTGGAGDRAPRILNLQAKLNGDQLTLSGTVLDSDGDITQAQSELFNRAGEKVGETAPFPVSFGNLTTISFTLEIDNLNSIPSAELASLTFIDRGGNRSDAMIADFGKADPDGPTLKSVTYNGAKMTIKGAGLAGDLQIEINGQVIAAGFSASLKKIKIKGGPDRLNLRNGPNRVRVFNGDSRSNLLIFNF